MSTRRHGKGRCLESSLRCSGLRRPQNFPLMAIHSQSEDVRGILVGSSESLSFLAVIEVYDMGCSLKGHHGMNMALGWSCGVQLGGLPLARKPLEIVDNLKMGL
ncbi:hypothetical protein I7I50_10313 [Histoplasma capsulatum G186AR]|uniref:Uncharacterized protein n=1 Tax=Ajellomyces capsulatus TaxID=5037 RepID=A0A8H7Z7F4_AJECA|nr:hypothetical protein I7I52_01552 [Histoplasma capsulatum]QSS69130.1 hypothetical protein I7I50_10313 [Histoplasma capsulatum G186AR]